MYHKNPGIERIELMVYANFGETVFYVPNIVRTQSSNNNGLLSFYFELNKNFANGAFVRFILDDVMYRIRLFGSNYQ